MLLDNEVEIEISPKTKMYLESLNYDFSDLLKPNIHGKLVIPRGTKVTIKTSDLKRKSGVMVRVLCDYCNKNIVKKHYSQYLDSREVVPKDCCDNVDCLKQKRGDVIKEKYSVTNVNKLKEVRDKIKETNLERRGVEYTFQSKEVRDKGIKTLLEKYDVDNISKNKKFQDKKINTFIERFGVDNPLKSSEVKDKIKQSNLLRHGVEWPTQNPEIFEKTKRTNMERYGAEYIIHDPKRKKQMMEKALMTLYKNNSLIGTSKQQIYLCSLLNGELNYPISNVRLDIALLEEKIYIEYDGSGHDLRVKFGDITEKDFKLQEINRGYFLNKRGWKRIRIISIKDYLPSDDKIIETINFAKGYLNSSHSWIHFDIDNNLVKTSQFEEFFDFGELRKIKKEKVS